ncbi:hypothetical protein [Brevibacillus brevis]|uniref:DUF2007 domain-containing protein n=1 Tax=Brevibacillus brevis TaxID=1393 RepID=A0A517IAG2_BREBE|nr:hypothetical protein [Brevibacillus brevis]QDS35862.1 hypothetical protein FPS98_18595 [Brevibacillus brevis]
MERSFYYVVTWTEANALVRELSDRFIPFALVQSKKLNIPPNQIAIVFPDLNVRVYAVVRELFGGDGVPYPQ